jgi:erythromycin esterase-like protein
MNRTDLDSAPPLPEMIARAAEPLPALDDPTFGRLFDRWGDRRVVLLGEASHGTAEFYRARAAISRHLIEHHGFDVVAVEADWPDAAVLDAHVRLRPRRDGSEPPFQRFPTWMWRNTEVAAFLDWLRGFNADRARERQAGFYGLDIYNMGASIQAVLTYLDEVDPEAAGIARERYGCLQPWHGEPALYGRAVLTEGYRRCEKAVVQQWRDLLENRLTYTNGLGL